MLFAIITIVAFGTLGLSFAIGQTVSGDVNATDKFYDRPYR